MGLFSSKSSTTNTTNQQDNRRVIGEGGVSAENSIVTYQTLDGDVANRAISAVNEASFNALDFGAAALNFGSNTVTKALNFGGDALAFADASAQRSQQMAYNTVQDALATSSDAFNKALSFGAGATGRALDSLASTENLVKDAYADAKGRGALTDYIILGAIAVMGVVAFMAVKK